MSPSAAPFRSAILEPLPRIACVLAFVCRPTALKARLTDSRCLSYEISSCAVLFERSSFRPYQSRGRASEGNVVSCGGKSSLSTWKLRVQARQRRRK